MRRIELNHVIAAILCGLIAVFYLFTTCLSVSSPILGQILNAISGGMLKLSGADLIGQNFFAILPVLIAIAGAVLSILMPRPVGAILSGVAAISPLIVALCGSGYVGSIIRRYIGYSGSGLVYSAAPGFGCYLCLLLGIGAAVCCMLEFRQKTAPISSPGVGVDEDDF